MGKENSLKRKLGVAGVNFLLDRKIVYVYNPRENKILDCPDRFPRPGTRQRVGMRLFLGRRKGVKTEGCLNLAEKVCLIET